MFLNRFSFTLSNTIKTYFNNENKEKECQNNPFKLNIPFESLQCICEEIFQNFKLNEDQKK